MKKKVFVILLAVSLVLITLAGCGNDEEISADFIGQKLELLSELVTAKMTYQGVVEYTDGNIPFLTQKECLMVYQAEAKASIDLSKIEINVTENEVTVRVPKEVTTEIHILPDSLKFYDSKIALFNPETKEDTVAAIQLAEEHIRENGGIEELEKAAMEQADLLIKSFVQEIIGEKTLTVIH